MIINGLQDWQENPVLMTVDTFDSQLESIDFPAITLCTSNEFQPDNWAITEHVFNSFKFNCELDDNDCDELRTDFEPFFRLLFDLISSKFDQIEFNPVVLDDLYENLYYTFNINIPNQEELDHLYWAKERNKLSLWMIDEVIMQLTGRKDFKNQINLYDMLPKAYNGSKECNEACWEFKKAIINSFIKADVLASISDINNFGTLLRLFSDEIGISFQNDPIAPYEYPCKDCWEKCYAIDEIENLIHKVMKKIASQFGMKASLHDVPNVFGNGHVYPLKTLFYPLYSICNAGNIFMMKLVRKLKSLQDS